MSILGEVIATYETLHNRDVVDELTGMYPQRVSEIAITPGLESDPLGMFPVVGLAKSSCT